MNITQAKNFFEECGHPELNIYLSQHSDLKTAIDKAEVGWLARAVLRVDAKEFVYFRQPIWDKLRLAGVSRSDETNPLVIEMLKMIDLKIKTILYNKFGLE